MNDLLVVLNPRRIPVCIDALEQLEIDKLWIRNMSERTIERVWADDIQPVIDMYDRAFVISDDTIPRPNALNAVRTLLDDGADVATGYCNLSATDMRVNITKKPLGDLQTDAQVYDFFTLAEMQEMGEQTVRTWFTGFCLTGMSSELWRAFPFQCEGRGWASDYNLSRRLADCDVPIFTRPSAFVWHVKEVWNQIDYAPEKRLLVGREDPSIDLDVTPARIAA